MAGNKPRNRRALKLARRHVDILAMRDHPQQIADVLHEQIAVAEFQRMVSRGQFDQIGPQDGGEWFSGRKGHAVDVLQDGQRLFDRAAGRLATILRTLPGKQTFIGRRLSMMVTSPDEPGSGVVRRG